MHSASRVQALPLCGAVLLAACGGSEPAVTAAEARAAPARGAESYCQATSWVAGITELCRGRLVYRDYVFDDYGADTGVASGSPFPAGTLAATAGDLRYPAGAESTADLVRLELALERDALDVQVELNALYSERQTVVAIAIDEDADLATGGGPWPGLAVASAGWERVHRLDQGDPASNVIRGRIPRPSGTRWRFWAVTAQADGTIMNVAFRGPDEKVEFLGAFGVVPTDAGAWWEDHQAAALAAGDITAFAAEVAVADLERGVTRGMAVAPGLHQRVYTSPHTLPPGEGVSLAGVPSRINESNTSGSQQFNFLGRYQPYGFYLPAGEPPHGLLVKLHGLGATHASVINQHGFQRDFGEAGNRVIVAPLGRGVVGFYSDISESDVLEVLDDALQNLPIDPEGVVMSGYSMGGYGALRLAMLHPDRFAGLVDWVGPTGDDTNSPLPGNPTALDLFNATDAGSFVGNMIDFAGNLVNVPGVFLYAGADALSGFNNSLALRDRLLAAEGVPHDFYLHPAADHFTFAVLDDWTREAAFIAPLRRQARPARVRFRSDASFAYPEYGIRHDRAYWVRGLQARADGPAEVDVESLACGTPRPVLEAGNDAGYGPLPLAWERQYRRVVGETPATAQDRVEATVSNVAAFTIDAKAACLRRGAAYRVETDGPVVIRFEGIRDLALGAGLHEGRL